MPFSFIVIDSSFLLLVSSWEWCFGDIVLRSFKNYYFSITLDSWAVSYTSFCLMLSNPLWTRNFVYFEILIGYFLNINQATSSHPRRRRRKTRFFVGENINNWVIKWYFRVILGWLLKKFQIPMFHLKVS